jgi:hypothetical protein
VARAALDQDDDSLLTTLTTYSPVIIVADPRTEPNHRWIEYGERHQTAVRAEDLADGRAVFVVPQSPGLEQMRGKALPLRRVTPNTGTIDLTKVTDGKLDTAWTTAPQRGNEEIVIELDRPFQVNGVLLALGKRVEEFPRELMIETSIDGRDWRQVWRGPTAGRALEAVLRDARRAPMSLPLPPTTAQFLRLKQLRRDRLYGWSVAELAVVGSDRP